MIYNLKQEETPVSSGWMQAPVEEGFIAVTGAFCLWPALGPMSGFRLTLL